MKKKKKKKNDNMKEKKDGKKAVGYQDQYDTYVIKIKKNLITVNNLVYKYRRFLSLGISIKIVYYIVTCKSD